MYVECEHIAGSRTEVGDVASQKQRRHDLILALQCFDALSTIDTGSLAYKRALAWAVKMAGGSHGVTIAARRLGYRACLQLFEQRQHELKLLLINAIVAVPT